MYNSLKKCSSQQDCLSLQKLWLWLSSSFPQETLPPLQILAVSRVSWNSFISSVRGVLLLMSQRKQKSDSLYVTRLHQVACFAISGVYYEFWQKFGKKYYFNNIRGEVMTMMLKKLVVLTMGTGRLVVCKRGNVPSRKCNPPPPPPSPPATPPFLAPIPPEQPRLPPTARH